MTCTVSELNFLVILYKLQKQFDLFFIVSIIAFTNEVEMNKRFMFFSLLVYQKVVEVEVEVLWDQSRPETDSQHSALLPS